MKTIMNANALTTLAHVEEFLAGTHPISANLFYPYSK
jgi:hypothetical protein